MSQFQTTGHYGTLMNKGRDQELTLDELACALYEGTPHLGNLAEALARQHGTADALTFFDMMGEDVQNFWRGIANQIIDHAKEWQPNQGGGCVLSDSETARLKALPRVLQTDANEGDASHMSEATQTTEQVTGPPSPRTIYRVLKYLADNEGAGWIEVGLGIDIADYVPKSPDALPFLASAEQVASDRLEDAAPDFLDACSPFADAPDYGTLPDDAVVLRGNSQGLYLTAGQVRAIKAAMSKATEATTC